MIIFSRYDATRAVEHVAEGGQSLCVGKPTPDERRQAPAPWCRALEWGQLLDRDLARLIQTAKDLGATPVRVQWVGDPCQSVILCGGPLRKAKERSHGHP